MNSNLFVGGFPYDTTQEELAAFFRACGTVRGVKILTDRETGRSRGLAFVEMSTEAEAREAISKLNGSALGARKIFVSEARPQEKRPGGGFAAKPGFVERRSGKDRRQGWGPLGGVDARRGERPARDEARREGSWARKKPWAGKPGFPGKKSWEQRSSFDRGAKKAWGGKPGGGKKWAGKPRKFGGGAHPRD